MQKEQKISKFWTNCLLLVTIGTMVFGASLFLSPSLARTGFSTLLFANPTQLNQFDPAALRYIDLLHGVLGAVMFGWGAALTLLVKGAFARGELFAWNIVAVSVLTWFIPDTFISVASGFWQNAVLNLFFLLLFAAPLLATYRAFHADDK